MRQTIFSCTTGRLLFSSYYRQQIPCIHHYSWSRISSSELFPYEILRRQDSTRHSCRCFIFSPTLIQPRLVGFSWLDFKKIQSVDCSGVEIVAQYENKWPERDREKHCCSPCVGCHLSLQRISSSFPPFYPIVCSIYLQSPDSLFL